MLRVRLVPLNMLKSSSDCLLSNLFCYLCFIFIFVMLSCLFLAALWSADLLPLLCVVFSCVFVTFPIGVPGAVMVLDCINS